MKWEKDLNYQDLYYTSEIFNGFQYNVVISIEYTDKVVKYWVAVSSGKKRKNFYVFEDSGVKSFGGIRTLFWVKSAMYDFVDFYSLKARGRKQYICIGWSDSRRRDIYKRLEKEGFQFMQDNGRKILMKKL